MKGTRIPKIVQRYVDHDMIKAHTKLPEMAHNRVALMYAFLNRNQSPQISELLAAVTSLVQLGLDTHDQVELAGSIGDDRNLRSRQLKVLAGDYFSSRFYQLLAQAGQIDAIRALSRAVCDVNRKKMTIVDKMNKQRFTSESYLYDTVQLRQSLFHAFNDRIAEADIPYWESLLYQISTLEVLELEWERLQHFDQFEGSWGYWMILEVASLEEQTALETKRYDLALWKQLLHKYQVLQQLTNQLTQAQVEYERLLSTLSKDLYEELAMIVHSPPVNSRMRFYTGAPQQG